MKTKNLFILYCISVLMASCFSAKHTGASMVPGGDGYRFCNLATPQGIKCLGVKFQNFEEWLQENRDHPREGPSYSMASDNAIIKSLRPDFSTIRAGINVIIYTDYTDPENRTLWTVPFTTGPAEDGFSLLIKANEDCNRCTLVLRGTARVPFQNESGIKIGQRWVPNERGSGGSYTDPEDVPIPIAGVTGPCGPPCGN